MVPGRLLHSSIDGYRRIPKAVTVLRATKAYERFKREYRKARLRVCRPDFVAARRTYEAGRVRRQRADPEQRE